MSLLGGFARQKPCKKLVSLKGELTIPSARGEGHPGIPGEKPRKKARQIIEIFDAQIKNISFSVMRIAA
jgi:hypothetical protein